MWYYQPELTLFLLILELCGLFCVLFSVQRYLTAFTVITYPTFSKRVSFSKGVLHGFLLQFDDDGGDEYFDDDFDDDFDIIRQVHNPT